MKVRPIHFVPDVDEALRLYAALGLVPHARSRVGNWVELEASGGELGVHDGRSADDGSGAKGSFSALSRRSRSKPWRDVCAQQALRHRAASWTRSGAVRCW